MADDPNLPKSIQNENERGSSASHKAGDDELNQARSDLGDKLLQAEDLAALKKGQMPSSPAMQEKQPSGPLSLGDAQDFYRKSRAARKAKGPRGILIGVGAGGGIISVVAGLGFLLPFKLPGIMNTIIGDAGKRLEQVIERRAEKVFLQFVLRGTRAAGLNGNLIATGNPIGDLFANMRTANFEFELKEQFGLEFKPGPNKGVILVHDGRDLGEAKLPQDIIRILESGQSLNKADLRRIIKATQTWGFLKRAKYVKWLRLKYNIPRFGTDKIKPDETEEAYNQKAQEGYLMHSVNASSTNAADFAKCIATGGEDCQSIDKTGTLQKLADQTREALTNAAKEIAQKGMQAVGGTLVGALITKLAATGLIPVVGQIDVAVRLMHLSGAAVDDNLLQVEHAKYTTRSSVAIGAALAGLSDQTAAGDLPASTVGIFAERFNDWETSASYHLINEGKLQGETLDSMERINESLPKDQFLASLKNVFGAVGVVWRAPAEVWFYTISKGLDFIGLVGEAAVAWILKQPLVQSLVAQFTPYLNDMLAGIFKVMGLYIDPMAVGAKLAMYVHQGFLATFNGFSKEMGMRLLTLAQGRIADAEIRREERALLAEQSFFDRILNPENPSSLATKLAMVAPNSSSNPVLAFASTGTRMVMSAPANLAKLASGTAYADGEIPASEELFNINMYGGTSTDLEADLHPNVSNTQPVTCPENRDDAFNHCKVDPMVVDAWNCSYVKCADMKLSTSGEFDGVFTSSEPTANPFSWLFTRASQPAILETKRQGTATYEAF